MEVKVTFEDFDLEAIVEKAIVDEINRLTGSKIHSMMKEANMSIASISELVNRSVERETTKLVNSKSSDFTRMIEQKIDQMLDKEIEGIIRKKVAKIMTPYIQILQEQK